MNAHIDDRPKNSGMVILVIPTERVDEYLGVGYLAAVLKSQGFDVRTLQGQVGTLEAHLQEILAHAPFPALIGFSCPYIFSEAPASLLANKVRMLVPNVPIAFGGHTATMDCVRLMESVPEIDFVIRGEGEDTLVELLASLSSGSPLDRIRGLALRGDDGRIVVTTSRPRREDLDSLPFPDRETLVQSIASPGNANQRLVQVVASRGCYAACEFCSMVAFYSLDGRPMQWRPRSVTSVAAEIQKLVEEFGARSFWFVDDEFLGPPRQAEQRLLSFADALGPLGIEFGFDARANGIASLEPSVLAALRTSGLRVVSMGIESGSQQQLDRLRKGISVDANRQAITVLREAGLEYRFGFIMYDQGTTIDDLRKNIDFLRFAGSHRICNSGPFRLLNAEFPEIGSRFYRRLNLTKHRVSTEAPPDLPRLNEEQLGYSFVDRSVARHRDLLRQLAIAVVEPEMTARRFSPTDKAQDLWFGTNLLPSNVAAMDAFLLCHEWLLEHLGESCTDAGLLARLSNLFQQTLKTTTAEARTCQS